MMTRLMKESKAGSVTSSTTSNGVEIPVHRGGKGKRRVLVAVALFLCFCNLQSFVRVVDVPEWQASDAEAYISSIVEKLTLPLSLSELSSSSDSSITTINEINDDDLPATKNHNYTYTTKRFKRYDRVVIVTKIHGHPMTWATVVQSLCLLHHAYNHKVLYDIIIFTAESISADDVRDLQTLVAPARVKVIVDNQGFQEEVAALAPNRRGYFLEMCNVTSPDSLDWFSSCGDGRLAYNWQAEFRGLRLWHHPALAEYKTMIWLDSDGFSTKEWPNDPVEYFIENDGAIMFDHFPQGGAKGGIQKEIGKGFNHTICSLKLSKDGNLEAKIGGASECFRRIPNIHGFFHITNLDFFRSEAVTRGLQTLYGDGFLRRNPDDQLAVTAPAAILAPERSWEMRSKGFHLDVFHNYKLDGIDQAKPAGFLKYYPQHVSRTLPSTIGVCPVKAGGR